MSKTLHKIISLMYNNTYESWRFFYMRISKIETNQKEKLPKTLPKAGITNNILLIMGILITTCLIFIKYKSIKLK